MLKKTALFLALSLAVPAAVTAAQNCQPIKSASSLKAGLPVPKNFASYSNFSDVTNRFIERITQDRPPEDAAKLLCNKYAFSYILYMGSEKELSRICSDKKTCENVGIILSGMIEESYSENQEAKIRNALKKMGVKEQDILNAASNDEKFMRQHQELLLSQFGELN